MDIRIVINETDIIRKILERLELWEEKISLERAPPLVILEEYSNRMIMAGRSMNIRQSRYIEPVYQDGTFGLMDWCADKTKGSIKPF